MSSIETRFWAKVDRSGGPDACWPWTGAKLQNGYGEFRDADGQTRVAHRLARLFADQPIPDELVADHLCHDETCKLPGPKCPHRGCCNPKHINPTTAQKNVLRGQGVAADRARQTHCVNGHLLDEANTYRRADRIGRQCQACQRENEARYRSRRKA